MADQREDELPLVRDHNQNQRPNEKDKLLITKIRGMAMLQLSFLSPQKVASGQKSFILACFKEDFKQENATPELIYKNIQEFPSYFPLLSSEIVQNKKYQQDVQDARLAKFETGQAILIICRNHLTEKEKIRIEIVCRIQFPTFYESYSYSTFKEYQEFVQAEQLFLRSTSSSPFEFDFEFVQTTAACAKLPFFVANPVVYVHKGGKERQIVSTLTSNIGQKSWIPLCSTSVSCVSIDEDFVVIKNWKTFLLLLENALLNKQKKSQEEDKKAIALEEAVRTLDLGSVSKTLARTQPFSENKPQNIGKLKKKNKEREEKELLEKTKDQNRNQKQEGEKVEIVRVSYKAASGHVYSAWYIVVPNIKIRKTKTDIEFEYL